MELNSIPVCPLNMYKEGYLALQLTRTMTELYWPRLVPMQKILTVFGLSQHCRDRLIEFNFPDFLPMAAEP